MFKAFGVSLVVAVSGIAFAEGEDTQAPASGEEKAGCICTKEYRPVCSKDGKRQFGNACEARCAGVTDFTEGACGRTTGSSGDGLQQTAADCKPGQVFKPFPCLVAPCKYGRCERSTLPLYCGEGKMKSKVFCKPGAMDCKPFICVPRPQCGGIAALKCAERFRCVMAAKHPDASGSCYATCKSNASGAGCYPGEVCEDLKMITPVGVCKEKKPLIIKPGALKTPGSLKKPSGSEPK